MPDDFCTLCGGTLAPGAKFCGNCGSALVAMAPAASPVHSRGSSGDVISHPRPWVRFCARFIDLYGFTLVVCLLLVFLSPELMPSSSPYSLRPAVLALFTFLAWVFVEPELLSTIGTTPGKWLLRTKIIPVAEGKFTYSSAFSRALKVWWRGLGIGLPFVSLVTLAFAYRRLRTTGTTSWDSEGGFEVAHERIGGLRTLVALFIVAAHVSIVLLVNGPGRLGSLAWKEVQTSSRLEDDGAVCLANLLKHCSRRASLDELRFLTLNETGAANAQKIMDAARRYGLKLRGVKVDSKDFDVLLLPAILHWRESSGTFPEGKEVPRLGPGEARFVLLEDIRGDQIVVAFSDVGRRTITRGELLAHATGIVLMPEDC